MCRTDRNVEINILVLAFIDRILSDFELLVLGTWGFISTSKNG